MWDRPGSHTWVESGKNIFLMWTVVVVDDDTVRIWQVHVTFIWLSIEMQPFTVHPWADEGFGVVGHPALICRSACLLTDVQHLYWRLCLYVNFQARVCLHCSTQQNPSFGPCPSCCLLDVDLLLACVPISSFRRVTCALLSRDGAQILRSVQAFGWFFTPGLNEKRTTFLFLCCWVVCLFFLSLSS